MSDEWVSLRQAAPRLGLSHSTIYRMLRDEAAADRVFGAGNWRLRPYVRRPTYQIRAARVAELVTAEQNPETVHRTPPDTAAAPAVSIDERTPRPAPTITPGHSGE